MRWNSAARDADASKNGRLRGIVGILIACAMLQACASQLYSSSSQGAIHRKVANVARHEIKSLYRQNGKEEGGILLVIDVKGQDQYEVVDRAGGRTKTEAALNLVSSSPEACGSPASKAVAVFVSPPNVGLPAQFENCAELTYIARRSNEYGSRISATEVALRSLKEDLARQMNRVDAALADLDHKSSMLKDENSAQWRKIGDNILANQNNRADLESLTAQVDKATQSIRDDDDQIQSLIRDVGERVTDIGKRIK